MKKEIIFLLIAVTFLISQFGCENEVSPKTEYEENYILNCVLRASDSLQIATISSTYNPPGLSGDGNTIDPFVAGAHIQITHGNETFVLRDSFVVIENRKYDTPIPIYYTNQLKPQKGEVYQITATMPDNTILTSATEVPHYGYFYFYDQPTIFPIVYENFAIYWELSNIGIRTPAFFPKFYIVYYVEQGNEFKEKYIEIPSRFIVQGNQKFPDYPKPTSDFYTFFKYSVFWEVFKSIPEQTGYAPSEIYIDKATFELIVPDEITATYYSSQITNREDFTIDIFEPDITNINGGKGIFGAYLKFNEDVHIRDIIIDSLGYKRYTQE